MSKAPSDYPQRLKRIREFTGMSVRDAAKEFGVSVGAISMWESGANPVPGPITKIIQIYEQELRLNVEPIAEKALRKVSTRWSRVLMKSVGARSRASSEAEIEFQKKIQTFLTNGDNPQTWRDSLRLQAASRALEVLLEMKGLPLKIAQLGSYVDLGFPHGFRELLESVHQYAPPMAASAAAMVIQREFGVGPRELFAEWDPKPFAVASIGQVHRAKLKSGEAVAVKIQYPEIAEVLASDLNKLSMMSMFASWFGKSDEDAVETIREYLQKECDYIQEATAQEKIAGYFEGHPVIRVPHVFWNYTRPTVLTQELFEGRSFAEFKKSATDQQKQNAGAAIAEFYQHGFFLSGMLQADPHPGNFVFMNSQVGFVDFGRVAQLSPAESWAFHELYQATLADDLPKAREVLIGLGVIKDATKFDFEAFWKLNMALYEPHFQGEFRFTRELVQGFIEKMQAFPSRDQVRSKSSFFWSNTTHLALWSILGELETELNWRAETLKLTTRVQKDRHAETWRA